MDEATSVGHWSMVGVSFTGTLGRILDAISTWKDTFMIPSELQQQLAQHGFTDLSEVALREALEAHAETYTLIKLAPWPARRWKCRYRLMMSDQMYDAQTAAEAYALGLLARLESNPPEGRPSCSPVGGGKT